MPDVPTFSDLFRIARDEVLSRNSLVSRDAVEREGMDANILVAAAAALGDEIGGQIADLGAALFLDSAVGDTLDHLVYDRYKLIRKPAAASIGSAQFSTATASPSTFTIPTGTILQTSTGLQFITTESVIFLVGTAGPLTAAVRSVLAGPDQNAKIGMITSIVSAIPSAPGNLTVTNQFATVGADAAEKDEALRDRARKFFTTARRGTMKALEAVALGVPGVRTATAFEMIDALGRPARFVQLVVADAFTEQFVSYDTVPPRYERQSQVLANTVFDALSDTRAAGVYVQVKVANVVLQPIQLSLTFEAGADVNTVALQARSTVANYVNSLAPGSDLKADDLQASLQTVPGLAVTGGEIFSPPGDVNAKPLQVIRTTLGLVSAVSAQTDQPITTGNNPDAYALAQG